MWSGGLATSDRNIVITGFMGTGKSIVGRHVAEMLGRPFVDTDEEIVKRIGMAIPEIFATYGEEGFRHIEKRICRFYAAQRGYVMATGGGMLVDEGNREVMVSSGFVVCLNARPEVIRQRLLVDPNERPLLAGDWLALLEQRKPAYAEIPYQVDTSDKSSEQVAEEIVSLWQSTSV
jgi:shikimate kinase